MKSTEVKSKTETKEKVLSYRDALARVMRHVMEKNPRAIILGQGVDDHKGIFGTTLGLAKEFGHDRVMDTPLAEESMTGIAIGAALNGLYPIQTHIRVDFSLLAFNQIINLAAKYRYMSGGQMKTPLFIRMVIGRSWGQGAQHSQSFQSLFAHIPGLVVIMPASSESILECYPYLMTKHDGPVISIEHRLMYDLKFKVKSDKLTQIENPMTSYLIRSGKDVTIVATSIMVLEARRAAQHLAKEGIDCEIIDLNCVSHPGRAMIVKSVKKTGRLLVADTSWQAYGVSAEVCRMIAETEPSALKAPVITLGLEPASCPTGKTLEDLYYPNLKTLTNALAILVTGKKDHGLTLPEERSMADKYKHFKGPF